MDPAVRSFLSEHAAGSHVGLIVQDDAFLAASVAEWAAGSLRAGGGALLVGTTPHLEQIRTECSRRGVDLGARERAGLVVLIDAEWLLAKFMLDGAPDGPRFRQLLDEILAGIVGAVGSSTKVRAWGEMVSVLRLRNDAYGARKLEALWGEALHRHGFSLMCSYHTGHPDARPSSDLLKDVASSHASWMSQPMELDAGR